jgi:toxin FitB
LSLDLLYVSAAALADIRFGIELIADANRRAELNDWLAHKVRLMFEQRLLPITEDIMFKWRLLVEDGRKAGHTFSQPDLIIAATALQHGLTVVTRDVSVSKGARARAQSVARREADERFVSGSFLHQTFAPKIANKVKDARRAKILISAKARSASPLGQRHGRHFT